MRAGEEAAAARTDADAARKDLQQRETELVAVRAGFDAKLSDAENSAAEERERAEVASAATRAAEERVAELEAGMCNRLL